MKRILIVDDNAQNLYLLQVLLETNGFEIIPAANGAEALDKAYASPPDMIVSDILMPVMDGFSLCRHWKNDERLRGIPFVFYTATYTDTKDEDLGLSLGADRFIVKPVMPDELLAALQEVLKSGEKSRDRIPAETPIPDNEYFKVYNEALVRKLESKMLQIEQANRRLAALYQASCDLRINETEEKLIRCVLNAIVDTAGYQRVLYFRFDPQEKKLAIVDGAGFPQIILENLRKTLVFPQGETQGLVGAAALSGKMINIADAPADPRWIAFDSSIRSALYMPVQYEKAMLGVLALFAREMDAFGEIDERNIAALLNSLAMSMENLKNKQSLKQMNAHLEQRVVERTAQLEASNKELETFAYTVSHDLRAPLRSIEGFIRILIEDYGPGMDGEGKRLLDIIFRQTERLDRLITDLLAISKVNLIELNYGTVRMQPLVETVFRETASPDEQSAIEFIVDPLPDVHADPVLMRQVWSNLIANALKYSRPKPKRSIHIMGNAYGDHCEFMIQDNGIGFDPRFTDKLFGLFQRLHNSEDFEGTGIGLAIVKRIVERHGGHVLAQGTPNEGAQFTFSIPVNNQ